MEQLLGIAERIGTPLSLAALVILVLYSLFKIIFERLNLQAVIGDQVYRLLQQAMTFLFVLAITALVLGLGSFLVTKALDTKRTDLLIKQLSDPHITTRVGSIGALRQIAHSGMDSRRICDALSLLVRNNSRDSRKEIRSISEDAQAAVSAISDLLCYRRCDVVDLQGSELARLQLPGGCLEKVNLTNASLDDANLREAKLAGARLIGASLRETVLRQAKLNGADFKMAEFENTDLRKADLSSAKGLAGADLWASLEEAIFDDADLRDIQFRRLSLKGISLKHADLRGADLSRTTGLCREMLARAQNIDLAKRPTYEC